ncbi:MAG: Bug family tripartite tricarboxylate transporter substrate binding protein [Geminicoccaceae bacterium]
MNRTVLSPCRRQVLAALLLSGTARLGSAQEKYPDRPIRIIVPAAAGIALDIVARVLADGLRKKYEHGVIVENRPGASGMIGMQAYARMPADGYTLLAGGLGLNVLPSALFTNLPLDPMTAFVPIAQISESANILVVRGDLPASNLQELVAAAKAKPGELKMGTNDLGSSMHLAYELLAQRTGTTWIHVPYRGPNEVLAGLLSDTVDAGVSSMGPFVQMIKAGRIKAIAVTTAYRQRALPDVPTVQEAGISDFDVGSWLSLHALPDTPPAIIDKVSRDVIQVLEEPEYRTKLEAAGYTVRTLDAREFKKKSDAEFARWSEVAKKAGVVMDYKSR